MKKNYVKPELEMLMLSPVSLMVTGSMPIGGEGEAGTNKKEQDERSWGRDLWSE